MSIDVSLCVEDAAENGDCHAAFDRKQVEKQLIIWSKIGLSKVPRAETREF